MGGTSTVCSAPGSAAPTPPAGSLSRTKLPLQHYYIASFLLRSSFSFSRAHIRLKLPTGSRRYNTNTLERSQEEFRSALVVVVATVVLVVVFFIIVVVVVIVVATHPSRPSRRTLLFFTLPSVSRPLFLQLPISLMSPSCSSSRLLLRLPLLPPFPAVAARPARCARALTSTRT